MSGNWSFVFGPEAAAVLVRALVRALHGPSAPDVKAVGPAWRVSDVPAHFMWRHKLAYGVANNVSISPPANGRIYGENIIVK